MVDIKIDNNKLKQTILDKAREDISHRNFDVTCPHCNSEVTVPAGESPCPVCGKEINLTLNFKF